MGFYSANRFGIELKKKQGMQSGLILARFIENPQVFLSTTLIGFTLSLVSFVLLFDLVTIPLWNLIGLKNDIARLILDIVLATFVVLIFAEFIPRAIFRAHSNLILSKLVWVINFFYGLLQPVGKLFIGASAWILKYIFNITVKETKEIFPGGSLETLFQPNSDADVEPQKLDTDLFDNALNIHNTKVRRCLVPRKEIIGVEIGSSISQVREMFIDTKLSKLIV